MPDPPGTTARPNSVPLPFGPGGAGLVSSIFTATCWPCGVVSTRLPSPPLAVRMSPLGAMARPSGSLIAPPAVIWVTLPGVVLSAWLTDTILLSLLSAMNSVSPLRPRPVGPTTSDAGSVRSGSPLAITVSSVTFGLPVAGRDSPIRTTVPPSTTFGLAATVPLRTLVTNSVAVVPASTAVISHGPLIGPPEIVATGLPDESRTIRHPACMVAELPFLVGRLPTMTNPPRSATSAVVRPMPPGHGPGSLFGASDANWVTLPVVGEISTMVLPVPCRLRWLLKLLTSTSPATSRPAVTGGTATPYGLTSPFFGTVDASVCTVSNGPMNEPGEVAAAGVVAIPAAPRQARARPTANRRDRSMVIR